MILAHADHRPLQAVGVLVHLRIKSLGEVEGRLP
jgi:hypothetical protein